MTREGIILPLNAQGMDYAKTPTPFWTENLDVK
jgi:hypothetical protein